MVGRQPLWPNNSCRRQRLGTLPCGWTTEVPRSLRRVFIRAAAMPNTDTSTVFDEGRSIIEIQTRPVVVLKCRYMFSSLCY